MVTSRNEVVNKAVRSLGSYHIAETQGDNNDTIMYKIIMLKIVSKLRIATGGKMPA